MVTKLRLILKKPILESAFNALIFGVFFYFYYLNPSWWRAGIFLIVAFWLYNRHFFNFSCYLRGLFVLLALALWTSIHDNIFGIFSLFILTISFGFFIGIKNLILIHRHYWHVLISLAMSYLIFLNFFLLDKAALFLAGWLAAIIFLALIFIDLLSDRVAWGVLILLMAELLWIINWLPIGPLSAANLSMLSLLFLLDSLANKRLKWKNIGLFAVLTVAVLGSSYWKI